MTIHQNQDNNHQKETKNAWSIITFFTTIYLSLKAFTNTKSFLNNHAFLLSAILSLVVKAIFEYDVNWKANLTIKKENLKSKSNPESTVKNQSEEVSKTTLVQIALFTPLTLLYLFFRFFWLYLRICLYTFIDFSIFYLRSSLSFFLETDWTKYAEKIYFTLIFHLSNITNKAMSTVWPLFIAHFPKIEALITAALASISKKIKFSMSWLNITVWKNMTEPFLSEIKTSLLFAISELQPVVLRLAKVSWDYAYFFFYELGLDFKQLVTNFFEFSVSFLTSLNWNSFFQLFLKPKIIILSQLKKALTILQRLDYKPLLSFAIKKFTQDFLMDLVDIILFTSEVAFPTFLLWGVQLWSCLYSELPNLLLNVLVWFIEDVVISGTQVAIRTHQQAWDSSRVLYRHLKRISFETLERLNRLSPIISGLMSFFSAIQKQSSRVFSLVEHLYTVTMLKLSPVLTKLSSVLAIFHQKITFIVVHSCGSILSKAQLQWIPNILEQINNILETSATSEEPTSSSSFSHSISVSLKSSSIFLLHESKEFLESLTRTLEGWTAEQGRPLHPSKKSEPSKEC